MNFLCPEPYSLCPSDLCWTYLQSYLSTAQKGWQWYGSHLAQNLTQGFSEENRLSEFLSFQWARLISSSASIFAFPLPFPLCASLLLNRFLRWSMCVHGDTAAGWAAWEFIGADLHFYLLWKGSSTSVAQLKLSKSGRTESRELQEEGVCLFNSLCTMAVWFLKHDAVSLFIRRAGNSKLPSLAQL